MIWDWVNIYHMYLFQIILRANPLFCFKLWYSSCFEVKCGFHTFPKWCSHFPMWILILLDNRDCHLNSIPNRRVSFQVHLIIPTFARSVLSFSQWCSFHPTQVAFVFHPPTLFLQGLRFLNQVSILLMWSLFILFLQSSYLVILMKMRRKLQVHRSSFSYYFPVDSIQAFGVDHIPFLLSNAFSCRWTS